MTALVRAVVLDADGTLWDTRTAMEAAGAAGIVALWPDLPAESVTAAATRFRADPTGAFRRFVAGASDFDGMRAERLADVASFVDRAFAVADLGTFEAAYGKVFDRSLVAYADTAPFLAWCRQAGLGLRVLTNSAQAYTRAKVASTGLTDLADLVCSRDCLGVGKPDGRVFRHVCEQLGLAPEEVLYVGDEWTSDAEGAADAGLRSVWLVRADGDPAEEVTATAERLGAASRRGIPVIDTLAELPDLLQGGGDLGEWADPK